VYLSDSDSDSSSSSEANEVESDDEGTLGQQYDNWSKIKIYKKKVTAITNGIFHRHPFC